MGSTTIYYRGMLPLSRVEDKCRESFFLCMYYNKDGQRLFTYNPSKCNLKHPDTSMTFVNPKGLRCPFWASRCDRVFNYLICLAKSAKVALSKFGPFIICIFQQSVHIYQLNYREI